MSAERLKEEKEDESGSGVVVPESAHPLSVPVQHRRFVQVGSGMGGDDPTSRGMTENDHKWGLKCFNGPRPRPQTLELLKRLTDWGPWPVQPNLLSHFIVKGSCFLIIVIFLGPSGFPCIFPDFLMGRPKGVSEVHHKEDRDFS